MNLFSPLKPEPFVKLDWREYFRFFSLKHGGNPVLHNGRLLFEDGWQYSATNYGGPEWPPPDDDEEFKGLIAAYLLKRVATVKQELVPAKFHIVELKRAMRTRDAVIHRIVERPSQDDGQGRIIRTSEPLDDRAIAEYQGRIDWLESDVAACEAKLEAVRNGSYERPCAEQWDAPQFGGAVDLPGEGDGPHRAEHAEGDSEYGSELLHEPFERPVRGA